MKNLRYTVLLSLVVLLLAGCGTLPPIAAPMPTTSVPEQRAVEAPAPLEQTPTPTPAAIEVAPAVTTTVPMTATAPVTSTGAVTTTAPVAQPPESSVTPTTEQVMGANPLVGVVWEWAATLKTKPAAQSVVPDPASYTVVFGDNGEMLIKADCNTGRATYTLENDQLAITPGAFTRVACQPGSFSDTMITSISKVATYLIDGGDLILRVPDTGDSLLFRNGGPSSAPAAPPAVATEAPAGAAAPATAEPTAPAAPTAAAPAAVATEAPAGAAAAQPQLVGTTWQWEKFVDVATGKNSMDVKNPANYAVTFTADGRAAMKADCNQAAGTYKIAGSQLTVEVGPVTLVACGATSLTDTFLINLTSAASFKIENGKLNVDLIADGGRMVFGAAK